MKRELRVRWRWVRRHYGYGPLLCIPILIALAVATYSRNQTWRDPEKLWDDVAAKSPDKPRAWFGLASVYMARYAQTASGKDWNASMAALFHADVLARKQGDRLTMIPAETDMAIMLMRNDDYENAEHLLRTVLADSPGYSEALAAMAMLDSQVGDPAEAVTITNALLKADWSWMSRSSFYATRAQAFCRMGETDKADQNYNIARKVDSSLPRMKCE